jgi:hypothetical protein
VKYVVKASVLIAVAALSASLWSESVQTKVIDVTLCDLVDRPLEFANKHVRVRGKVKAGYEYSGLTDDRCHPASGQVPSVWLENIPDTPVDDAETYARGWSMEQFIKATKFGELSGDGPPVTWETPSPLRALDEDQRRALTHALTPGARVVVIGRYDCAGDGLLVRSRDGRFSFRKAYGHLNCCPGRIVPEAVDMFTWGR